MYGIFKSLVVSEIAVKDIDVYGAVVFLNRRLSQEFVRKSLAKCFIYIRKHAENERLNNEYLNQNDTSHWLGYLLHRDNDKPAVIDDNNHQVWYWHGKVHRDNNQPAVINRLGMRFWYLHGEECLPK